MAKTITISDRELICRTCGFITFGYQDMVEHLAQYVEDKDYYRVPEENCSKKLIEFGEIKTNSDNKF